MIAIITIFPIFERKTFDFVKQAILMKQIFFSL